MALPYDAERVEQLRSMLREARKLKLSRAPGGKTGGITGSHGRPLILWIGGRLAGRVRPFTGAGDLRRKPGDPMKVTGKPAASTARMTIGCSRTAQELLQYISIILPQ
jgi:hypothetical protein